jgi:hypothetical protein
MPPLKAVLYIQKNIADPDLLYEHLPPAVQGGTALGTFVQAWSTLSSAFAPQYTNGAFTADQVNDTLAIFQATGGIPAGSNVVP